ncbi:MAG: hypothetical protein DME18_15705 [Verrucomicrobia bacterium]|nr:MAG: hypothetical protein DME18_15705 [Verrucomicrobiota bacterium]
MSEQFGEFQVAFAGEVHFYRSIGGDIFDAINAAIAAVPQLRVRVVTVLLIVPVDDIDSAIGAVLQIDRNIFGIAAEKHVLTRVHGVEPRAEAIVDLMIDLVAAEVVGEKVAAEFVRPVVAEIDHGADVRVAAVDRVAAGLARAPGAVIVTG